MTSSANATPRHPAMSFDERYRAISSRDTRFDGQFVTAVRTTGIYCRPSCPARTPKPGNVSFFATSAAAHEAGYRACKRCLPEAAPGSPAWDLRGDAASRAMRLIADGVIEREGVPGLARRLGYSTRHLTRMLTEELGAGPVALARAHRAQTARMLLVGTELTMADVAFSAGFASVRQFNDTVREIFGLTPSQLRARRPRAAGDPFGAPGGVSLALPRRDPFDAAGLFAWMSARALPGVEVATADSFARTVRLPGGPARFRVHDDGSRLRLHATLARLGDLPVLVARVRRLFDLDADPVAIDAALAAVPALRGSVRGVPGLRVPGAADPAEMLVRAMIGQQVSVAAARTALTRLAAALGERMPQPPADPGDAPADSGDARAVPGPTLLFPTPAAIAERGGEVLRGPAARVRAIVSAAEALAGGSLELSPGDDPAAQRAALIALPGIGPWTADYVRMRVTGDPDVLLPGDVAARAGAAALGVPADARGLTEWATRAAPWRSYLMGHLWRAALPRAAARPQAAPRPPAPEPPSAPDTTDPFSLAPLERTPA
ncbi:Ada metal-binding domain-containing protein [Microbacterium limosum]|uniref:DNA-3-methyladenine glycosylase II n=1 Tax=Microbacterium limosum TaxID=3079935 RepID=A0AAU0MGI8_9MICO|nr:AlkA N-terminal domain-containing protein [Microbacterium sp. Y20]WOQ69147.1 Ada metal-binding domain-containing protein [Microbacterium sp. Y20]